MSEVTRVKVGRGATKEGHLFYYELEATVPSSGDTEVVKANLEGMVTGWLGAAIQSPKPAPPTLTPTQPKPTKEEAPHKVTIEDTRNLFTKDLEDMLEFSEEGEYIIIRPRRYLGTENFAKVASIIRDAGGEYVSAGRESHFRLAKK